jgi:hypothetical protein
MAELSKTAKRSTGKVQTAKKRICTSCKVGEAQVVQFAGFGPHGFYWLCQGTDKTPGCGFKERTR